jgi:hypothetical protein
MLIIWSFNIFIFAVCYLIVGLIKPNWALFFMKEPTRLGPVLISLALIMTAATMYGEGLRDAPISPENVKRAKEQLTDQQKNTPIPSQEKTSPAVIKKSTAPEVKK